MDWFSYNEMDYQGQKSAEVIYSWILRISTFLGFVVGFALGSVVISFQILFAGIILACLVAIPPWPMFKKNPIKWLPEIKPVQPKEKEKEKDNENSEKKKKKGN